MSENLKKFLEEAGKNEEMKKRISEMMKGEVSEEEAIAFAKEYGFTLTAEDFKPFKDSKLSLDELDAVAGGNCKQDPDCWVVAYDPTKHRCDGGKGLWF